MACNIDKAKKEINKFLDQQGIKQSNPHTKEKRLLVNAMTREATKVMELSKSNNLYLDTTVADSKQDYLATAAVTETNNKLLKEVDDLLVTEDNEDLAELYSDISKTIKSRESKEDKVASINEAIDSIRDIDPAVADILTEVATKVNGLKEDVKPITRKNASTKAIKKGKLEGVKEEIVKLAKNIEGLNEFLQTKPTITKIGSHFQELITSAKEEDKPKLTKDLRTIATKLKGTVKLNKFIKEITEYETKYKDRGDSEVISKRYSDYIDRHNKKPKATREVAKTFQEFIAEEHSKTSTEIAAASSALQADKTKLYKTKVTDEDVKTKEEVAESFKTYITDLTDTVIKSDSSKLKDKSYFYNTRKAIAIAMREVNRLSKALIKNPEDTTSLDKLLELQFKIQEHVDMAKSIVDADVKAVKSAKTATTKLENKIAEDSETLTAMKKDQRVKHKLGSDILKGVGTDSVKAVFSVNKSKDIGVFDKVKTVKELFSNTDDLIAISSKTNVKGMTEPKKKALIQNLSFISKAMDKAYNSKSKTNLAKQFTVPRYGGVKDRRVAEIVNIKVETNKAGIKTIVKYDKAGKVVDLKKDADFTTKYNPLTIFAKNGTIGRDGDFTLDDNLVEALKLASVGAYLDLNEVATQNSQQIDTFIKDGYGVYENTQEYHGAKSMFNKGIVPKSVFTEAIGKEVLKLANLKADKDMNASEISAIEKALGLVVLASLTPMGLTKSIDKKDITYKSFRGDFELSPDAFVEIVKPMKEFKVHNGMNVPENIAQKVVDSKPTLAFLGVDSKASNTYNSPKEYAQEKVSRTQVEVNEHNKKFGKRLNGNSLKFNSAFKSITGNLDADTAKATWKSLMLKTDEEIAKVQSSEGEKELLNRNVMSMAIDNMVDTWFKHGEDKFYIEWEKIKNGRHQIYGSTFNMQANHLTRFMVSYADMESSVKWDAKEGSYDKDDMHVFRLGVSQSLDLSVDKMPDDEVMEELKNTYVNIHDNGAIQYANTEEGKLLKAAVEAQGREDGQADLIVALRKLGGANHRGHILQTVVALNSLTKAAKNKYKVNFKHSLTVESDAVTSGMMLLLLQIGTKWAMNLLNKGGIYLDHKGDSDSRRDHKQFKSDGNEDLYESVTGDLQKVKASEGDAVEEKLVDFVKFMEGNGKIKWRNVVKPAVMVFIYGATMKSVVGKLGSSLGSDLLISALHSDNKEISAKAMETIKELTVDIAFAKKVFSGADTSGHKDTSILEYKVLQDGKFVITKDPKLMTPNNLVLTPMQIEQINKVSEGLYGPVVVDTFSKVFKDVVEFRKTIKAVEVVSFKVFNYKFKEKAKDKGYLVNGNLTISQEGFDGLIRELNEEGFGYVAKDASGGDLDYTKTGKNNDSSEVFAISNNSRVNTGGSSQKEIVHNAGSTGVTTIHSIDDFLMSYAISKKKVLDLYDATFVAANAKTLRAVDKEINGKVAQTAREFNILGESINRVNTMLGKLTEEEQYKIQTSDYSKVSDLLDRIPDIADIDVAKMAKAIHKERLPLLSKPMRVTHYIVSDKFGPKNVEVMADGDYKKAVNKYDFNTESIKGFLAPILKSYEDRKGIRPRVTEEELNGLGKDTKALLSLTIKAGDKGKHIEPVGMDRDKRMAELVGGVDNKFDIQEGDVVSTGDISVDDMNIILEASPDVVITRVDFKDAVNTEGYSVINTDGIFKFVRNSSNKPTKAQQTTRYNTLSKNHRDYIKATNSNEELKQQVQDWLDLPEGSNNITSSKSSIENYINTIRESIEFQHKSNKPIIDSNKELFESIKTKLTKVYPNIKVEALDKIVDNEGVEVLGRAIDEIVQYSKSKAKLDTLPHEYAHIYIKMFKDESVVKKGIKEFGSEEELVQAIGEQVVSNEAKTFFFRLSKWIKAWFNKASNKDKQALVESITSDFMKGVKPTDKRKATSINFDSIVKC